MTHSPARALTRASLLARAPRQLRTGFKLDGRIYRVYPSGEVQYLHPKDGVYPEKVNKGRTAANTNLRSIGARHAAPRLRLAASRPERPAPLQLKLYGVVRSRASPAPRTVPRGDAPPRRLV